MADVNKYGYKAWAEAFTIFAKYEPEETFCVSAEHDTIYAGRIHPDKMEESDANQLKFLKWAWSENLECWSRFS
jgi:hypothetical protein